MISINMTSTGKQQQGLYQQVAGNTYETFHWKVARKKWAKRIIYFTLCVLKRPQERTV